MNILYFDFDGVINSCHDKDFISEDMVKVLSEICKLYNCEVVIESFSRNLYSDEMKYLLLNKLFLLFSKYNIECFGFTSKVSNLKESEIMNHLVSHPEIDHFAILDDDNHKDLELLKDHLVMFNLCDDNSLEEGFLSKNIDEVGKVLKLDNRFK